ncbi:hypothetical protein LshimejAT787_1203560 [Lyophyllum shimeji]|uniref:Uncharacterized protein n=1 Tax=Lyophyllum shimeji TaxID=47721 RepID=A0A9P3PU36_LYOSH|nr:hypothetical protein LshimejAT787_1203560 [Lyophyllum shimeji]
MGCVPCFGVRGDGDSGGSDSSGTLHGRNRTTGSGGWAFAGPKGGNMLPDDKEHDHAQFLEVDSEMKDGTPAFCICNAGPEISKGGTSAFCLASVSKHGAVARPVIS